MEDNLQIMHQASSKQTKQFMPILCEGFLKLETKCPESFPNPNQFDFVSNLKQTSLSFS